MTALVIGFREESLANHRSEELSYVAREKIQELNSREWQVIGRQTIDVELMTDIDNQRTALAEALDGLTRLNADEEDLALIQQINADYEQATDEEFGLISSGRMEEALAIDEQRIDPLFEQLDGLAVKIAEIHSDESHRKSNLSYFATGFASIFTLIVTSLLIWIYYGTLRKHRQVSTEKAILELSEERFRSVAQSANEAIITIDEHGRVTYWNSAATHMFGYEEDKALGQSVTFIMPTRFHEAHLAGMKRVVTTGETKTVGSTVELSGLKKDGSEFPVEASLSRWQSQQGIHFTAIIRDITKSKQVQAEQRTLSEALRQAAEAVLVLDADARITYLNPAFYRLFGYEPDEIIGQPIATLSVPEREDNLQPSEVIRQLNENGICREEVWRRAMDGTAIPVLLSTAAVNDASGDIAGYVGTYLDLREARQAEQVLRESESRLRVIMESVQTGIVIIDPDDHKIVDMNSIAASMIGASKEEIEGSVCHKFICPAEMGKCPITDLNQTVDNSERVLLTVTGEKRPIMKSVTKVLLGGKEHLLESYVDISVRKQMEERLGESLAEKEVLVQSLNELATRDGLTGLYNHRVFYTMLDDELVRAQRFNRPVSLLMLDIDHFKRVNDTHGHLAGDAVLSGLSELLGRQARAIDRVCRYGGEEITIILPETDAETAADAAERLRVAVEAQTFDVVAGEPLRITVSIGVASSPVDANSAQTLVAAADAAMFAAKRRGRNRIVRYEPLLIHPETQG